ncbi:Ig-like domain-containing protein [Vitiosangium sp. GDMCC 1.1324]|uniref:Ig-like domain-containing protein n=1 Tax=Vitiosangium sp. (strain GDMCC 1.1324) TaxID=2138576 RepID=UPI0018EE4B5F|nr:Ig-like domain-containing protein [Vitiosangium sp. GDMCC 1.1324]
MRRVLLVGLLGCAGCLEPGDPMLAARDTDPPEVVSTKPGAGGTVLVDGSLEVVFSESMDTRTLRPGIAVFEGRVELPLVLTVPPGSDVDDNVERGDVPYTVTVSTEPGVLKPGTAYTLVLRNSLTDFEGNPLRQEVRVPFRTEP